MSSAIVGASVWEQELFDHVSEHLETELGILDDYRKLAEETPSSAFRYLVELILDDETRHHRLFTELADAIRNFAELGGTDWPIPRLGSLSGGGEQILEQTAKFLALEEEDARFLQDLAERLRPKGDTTLWRLVVQMMQCDTEKHTQMLRFIADQAARPL
jgi:hypothetical protein